MTEKEIITEIERYLADTSYNYAVMIDGDWGCGKTYFVKNGLFKAIDGHEAGTERHRTPKYISLYGIKTVSDIQDAIVFALAEEITERKAAPEKQEEKTGVGRKFLFSTWRIAKAIRDIKAPDTNLYELFGNWLKLESFVFIFDDIERCDCPLNEVFGFINGLVEHEGVKVILVANEKEIRISDSTEQKGLQYLATINEKIVFPKAESVWRDEHEPVPLTPEELERRRRILFPAVEVDEDFKRIREKLIGVTLRYQPNIKDVCKTIIDASSFSAEIKCKLHENMDYFFATMQATAHYNIRTFQFFISRLKSLCDCLNDLSIPAENMNPVMDKVISDCFSSAVEFKANSQPPEGETAQIVYALALEKRSKAIVKYISTGELNKGLLQEEIDEYIGENLIDLIPAEDPYKVLQREYYLHPQKWCEEKIACVLEKLTKNEYPIIAYGEIIKTFLIYESMGFDTSNLDQAKESMLKNISVADQPKIPETHLYMFDNNSDAFLRAKRILSELENAVAEKNNTDKKLSIEDVLKAENWLEGLNRIIESNNLKELPNSSVFSCVDSSVWIDLLEKASPEVLYKFQQLFNFLYPTRIIRQIQEHELHSIKAVATGIELDGCDDLIVKNIRGWIREDMERVYSLYSRTAPTPHENEVMATIE